MISKDPLALKNNSRFGARVFGLYGVSFSFSLSATVR